MIAVIAVLWNLLGLAAFASDMMMTPERLAELSPEHQDIYAATPSWLHFPYGVAVIAGVLGSFGLLMRKAWSVPVLGISLLGVLIQQGYFFGVGGFGKLVSGVEIGFMIGVLVIAIFLVWFAHASNKAGRFLH